MHVYNQGNKYLGRFKIKGANVNCKKLRNRYKNVLFLFFRLQLLLAWFLFVYFSIVFIVFVFILENLVGFLLPTSGILFVCKLVVAYWC